jgi:hypothetical protein
VNHPCPRYEPELSAYLDGESTPALRVEIETHLRACEPCRAAVAQLRGVSRVLRRWDAQETRYATSSGFKNRVFTKIGVEDAAPAGRFAWRAAAAAALVAAGATGFALVAPRLRQEDDADIRSLAGEVAKLEQTIRSRPSAGRAEGDATPRDAAADVERVEPLRSTISPVAEDDAPAAPEPAPEVYEQRGGRSYLRDALPEHEDFARERDKLGLLEEMLKMQESRGAKAAEPNRTTQAAPAPSPLQTFFADLRVASGSFTPFERMEKVQVWPIEATTSRPSDPARPLTCEKSISRPKNGLRATERYSRDSVVVEVENQDAKRSVLILAGEVLVGAHQDRVAREDALIGPGDTVSIPTYGSGSALVRTSYFNYTSCSGIAPQGLRALVAADRALLTGELGQDRFGEYVADTVKSLASPQGRGSLNNLFSNPQLVAKAEPSPKSLEKRLDAPNVVGFAVTAGSRVLGVEVFGDHATFVDHRARLLQSYALAAIALSPDGTRLDGATPSRDAVAALVASSQTGVFQTCTTSGYGTLTVFRGVQSGPFGFGLLDGSHVVHASMFTSVPDAPEGGGRAGSHRGGGESSSAAEGSHSGGTRGGSSGGGEGATDSK